MTSKCPPKKLRNNFTDWPTLEPVQDVWHHQTCRWAICATAIHLPSFRRTQWSHIRSCYLRWFLLNITLQTIGSSPTKYFLNNRISRTSERLKVLARSWLISKCPRTLDSNLAWAPHLSQQEDLRIQHPGNIHSFLWQVQKPWGPPEEARPGHYPCMGSIEIIDKSPGVAAAKDTVGGEGCGAICWCKPIWFSGPWSQETN